MLSCPSQYTYRSQIWDKIHVYYFIITCKPGLPIIQIKYILREGNKKNGRHSRATDSVLCHTISQTTSNLAVSSIWSYYCWSFITKYLIIFVMILTPSYSSLGLVELLFEVHQYSSKHKSNYSDMMWVVWYVNSHITQEKLSSNIETKASVVGINTRYKSLPTVLKTTFLQFSSS